MAERFTSAGDLFAFIAKKTATVELSGMIKQSEQADEVLYSPLDCETWISISATEIEHIDYLGEQPCTKEGEEPHSHAVVRITLKEGSKDRRPDLATIGELVRRNQTVAKSGPRSRLGGPKHRSMARPASNCSGGYGPCGGWNGDWGLYCAEEERPCYENGYTTCEEFPECPH